MCAIEATSTAIPQTPPDSALAPRLWPGVVLVGTFWGIVFVSRLLNLPIFAIFMSNMAAAALLTLLFTIWWLTNRRIKGADRLFVFLAAIVCGGLAAFLADPSVGPLGMLLFGVPVSLSAWVVWLVLTKHRSAAARRWGLVVLFVLAWSSLTVVRVNGISGDNSASISWRWSPSAEDDYLAQRGKTTASAPVTSSQELTVQPGDWPEFRGPNRQGEVDGVKIATDWNAAGPKQLWRQRIGPAWSSVLIVGNRLFTQEQRGEFEVTVCLEADTGREVWSHQDKTRYSDGQAGAGPRATPTFSEGRIYSQGASGILTCLDAATGTLHWSRNIVTDSGAPIPVWGFSSSPLVTEGIVAVYAGGAENKGLLAYRAASGELAWTTATGPISYSSPQLASFDAQPQILLLSDSGLVSVEPESGTVLWQFDAPTPGLWRVVQPRQIDDHGVLIGSEDLGLVRVDINHDAQSWTAAQRWSSRAMRPAYNDFVVLDGFVYGFDEGLFCCLDVETGKRRWKAGRYGHGQVLLIADQRVLLVISETGEVVLLAARPDKHEELARFQSVKGKTWNHPVIAHGRLYVRNDEEIACYELDLAQTP